MEEIKQIYRDENTVKFSDGKSTMVVHKIIADPPEESFEAYNEWEGEEWNPMIGGGMYLFIYFRDFYAYNERAQKRVKSDFAQHDRYWEVVNKKKEEKMKLKPEELKEIIKESVKKVLEEVDRHRPGYYKDYAEKTGKKDRHSADYYKNYREAKKQETLTQDDTGVEKPLKAKKKNNKDRHKPGYYHNYNQEHPERLERGYTKGYVDGKVSNGPEVKQNGNIWYDELGRPHSNDFYNPTMTDMIDDRMSDWHDDDWEESSWDD